VPEACVEGNADLATQGVVRSARVTPLDPALRDRSGRRRRATALLVEARQRVDHVDLNFGCPSPKVTRHGGGAALPWRTDLYAAIVARAVAGGWRRARDGQAAARASTPTHRTYLEAARIAADLGVAAVTLHARTAEQRYGPPADWTAIARLVAAVDVPVLGNGDIWEAADALRMVDATGCAGVVVGRGCLGRPWLFGDLQAAFEGRPIPHRRTSARSSISSSSTPELLVEHLGPTVGLRELRKHTGWYLQGFPVGGRLRRDLNQVEHLDEVHRLLAAVDRSLPFDEAVRRQPRGHTTRPKRVVLPHGWLDARAHDVPLPAAAAAVISGG
jgi:nifR3 family TIM-barrel protein